MIFLNLMNLFLIGTSHNKIQQYRGAFIFY